MKTRTSIPFQNIPSPAARRGGFTLVEILVAVAIMSLLLSIIFVPLRLALETLHIGKVKAELQQEAHIAIQQVATDLRKSQFVFPNSRIPGVTDNLNSAAPCAGTKYPEGNTANPQNDWNYRPYVITNNGSAANTRSSPLPVDPVTGAVTGPMTYGACEPVATGTGTGMRAWNNPARLDMLQLRRDRTGSGTNAQAEQDYMVSYYFRRRDISKPYDAIDNPVVLFRAQVPYRNRNGINSPSIVSAPNNIMGETEANAQLDTSLYPDSIGTCNAGSGPSNNQSNRSFAWITHNFLGEANLEPLTKDAQITGGDLVPGAHTLVTPSDMPLFVPRAVSDPGGAESLVPELSFTQEATSGGRINRVTINLTLAKYDDAGAGSVNGQGRAQKVRVSQTIDLPNAGCTP